LQERVGQFFNLQLDWTAEDKQDMDRNAFIEKLQAAVQQGYTRQEEYNGIEQMRQLERMVLLQMVDTLWKEHLLHMDHLKEGIGLRGYGQKNPLNEYKREGYNLFLQMVEAVKQHTVGNLMRIQIVREDEVARMEEERRQQRERELEQAKQIGAGGPVEVERKPMQRVEDKIGRNALCPCGSGKKYKKCCGLTA
jgi:preprotein translocase subunit SecA